MIDYWSFSGRFSIRPQCVFHAAHVRHSLISCGASPTVRWVRVGWKHMNINIWSTPEPPQPPGPDPRTFSPDPRTLSPDLRTLSPDPWMFRSLLEDGSRAPFLRSPLLGFFRRETLRAFTRSAHDHFIYPNTRISTKETLQGEGSLVSLQHVERVLYVFYFVLVCAISLVQPMRKCAPLGSAVLCPPVRGSSPRGASLPVSTPGETD